MTNQATILPPSNTNSIGVPVRPPLSLIRCRASLTGPSHSFTYACIGSKISPSTAARFESFCCTFTPHFTSFSHRLRFGVFHPLHLSKPTSQRIFLTKWTVPPKQRSTAEPGTRSARCKLSVIAEASAGLSLNLPAKRLLPYDDHFHPTVIKSAKPVEPSKSDDRKSDVRKLGHPMVGVNLLPHEEQVIGTAMLEKWDYCLRRLFVLKGQTLKTAISYVTLLYSPRELIIDLVLSPSSVDRSLAPGAQTLLKHLTDPSLPPIERVDIKKQVRNLDIKDWALILRAFNNWPFAPEVSNTTPPSLCSVRC